MPDPKSNRPMRKETEAERLERQACLSCSLPDCNPHYDQCGIRRMKSKGRRPTKRTVKPVPPDFLTVAAGKTMQEIIRHYHSSWEVVSRWIREAGLQEQYGRGPIPAPPETFLYYGRVESLKRLSERYGVTQYRIARWRKDLKITPDTKL